MKTVGVLINLPTNQLNTSFTYSIPDHLADQASFGKRVLIDFAGKKIEGYIIDEINNDNNEDLKPLLRVLDEEAVFDQKLLALAKWIAEYYAASLAVVLTMMIPNILHRKKEKQIIAGIDADRYYKLFKPNDMPQEELFKLLWAKGQ